jgi:hypothetical protein
MRRVLDEGKLWEQRINVGRLHVEVFDIAPPARPLRAHRGLVRLAGPYLADRRKRSELVALDFAPGRIIGDPVAGADTFHRLVLAVREHAEAARHAAPHMIPRSNADPVARCGFHSPQRSPSTSFMS